MINGGAGGVGGAVEMSRDGMKQDGHSWAFHNPVRIHFGAGRLASLAEIIGSGRFLLVTTPGFTRRGVTEEIGRIVGRDRLVIHDRVEPNPDLSVIEEVGTELGDAAIGGIIALGGGSAIDTGKALAVLLGVAAGSFSLRAHLEDGAPLPVGTPLPLFAIPTTAGTGAEVTPFATIWDRASELKYSLAGPQVFPHTAILDPLLTIGLPEGETVASGLDALSQGLESIWNRNANPITISLATHAVRLSLNTLASLVRSPGDPLLRERMMEASLFAGLAISVTRTALAHSMSYPLTARHGIPHGLACSFTLPALLEYNLAVDDGRLATLAEGLGFRDGLELRGALVELLVELGVAERLRSYLPEPEDALALVSKMFSPGRADNNIRSASAGDLTGILSASFGYLGIDSPVPPR